MPVAGRMLALLVALALGWAAVWGGSALWSRAALAGWLEERRAAGWQAEWEGIALSGTPLMVRRRLTDPALADPEAGWAWQAPWLVLEGPGLGRGWLRVVWPAAQTLSGPDRRYGITADALTADLAFAGGRARPLSALALRADALEVRDERGQSLAARELALDLVAPEGGGPLGADAEGASGGAGLAYDLQLAATGLRPPAGWAEALARRGLAPERMERVTADLSFVLAAPLDRRALEAGRPPLEALRIREIGARWGALDLRLAGRLRADAQGLAEGDLTVQATNWREILALSRQTGLLPESLAGGIEGALSVIAGLSGRPETLDIPVTFRDGRTRLGPLPLGPAPPLRLP